MDDLLAEIKKKEEDANATADELRESLESVTSLLKSRVEELSLETIKSSKLSAANTVLELSNQKLGEQKDLLNLELSNARVELATTKSVNSKRVIDLEHKISDLIAAQHCLPVHSHHSHC